MKAVKIGNAVCIYNDDALPEQYENRAVYADSIPEKPEDCECYLDVVGGALVWVTADEPETVEVMTPVEITEE